MPQISTDVYVVRSNGESIEAERRIHTLLNR